MIQQQIPIEATSSVDPYWGALSPVDVLLMLMKEFWHEPTNILLPVGKAFCCDGNKRNPLLPFIALSLDRWRITCEIGKNLHFSRLVFMVVDYLQSFVVLAMEAVRTAVPGMPG